MQQCNADISSMDFATPSPTSVPSFTVTICNKNTACCSNKQACPHTSAPRTTPSDIPHTPRTPTSNTHIPLPPSARTIQTHTHTRNHPPTLSSQPHTPIHHTTNTHPPPRVSHLSGGRCRSPIVASLSRWLRSLSLMSKVVAHCFNNASMSWGGVTGVWVWVVGVRRVVVVVKQYGRG